MSDPGPTERLQKLLARAGFGSRREMERWIEAGRVSVNGRIASIGDSAGAGDKLRVDGKPVPPHRLFPRELRVLGYYKPEGLVVSRHDEKGRDTVFAHLPGLANGRWIAIGRLDLNTTGLLLFTNDGELANRLMHPSSGIDREYAVRVRGAVDNDTLQRLRDGVDLEDGPARFTDIVDNGGEGSNHWYHVALMEGRNREVRRLWESQGVEVSRLMRVRFGPVFLPRKARPGRFWDLEREEIAALLDWVGMSARLKDVPVAKPAAAQRGQRTRQRQAKAPARKHPRSGRR